MYFRHLILYSLTIITFFAPRALSAQALVGRVTVNFEGYRGWNKTQTDRIKIKFANQLFTLDNNGILLVTDMNKHGLKVLNTGPFKLETNTENAIQVGLEKKEELTFEIAWDGLADQDLLLLKPIECTILSHGGYNCETITTDLTEWEMQIRQKLNLQTQTLLTTTYLPPKVTPKRAVTANKPEPTTNTTQAAPQPQTQPTQAQPVPMKTQPAVNKPAVTELELIEPMD